MTSDGHQPSARRKGGNPKTLHFDVSTGLKSVIGRDLITDDEVAIFELVKNSFDAGAKVVQLRFEDDNIWLVDDGEGMDYEDIVGKWLFVAYSSKRETSDDFRETIAQRRHFAGSKGIGRFSSDRLGATLVLQTKAKEASDALVHQIKVDWHAFEVDVHESFPSVAVEYEARTVFDLPSDLHAPRHGTALTIARSRVLWDRPRILHLKASLAKLINPFGAASDRFKIEIIAPSERAGDDKAAQSTRAKGEEPLPNTLVNGEVGNFIFETLREKTTFIEVSLSEDGLYLYTTLTDRGEGVFKIRESNPYPRLANSGFKCQVFYLNQSAKSTFARRMGIPSVRFGSVFLFRNGFRVYPIGEAGDDWFKIDARKQQGYNRFLGTRDIIGRIDVAGTEEEFKEASSRNQGLVETEATEELARCFWEHCLKRLERYVVPVSWADKGERLSEDLSGLMTDSGRARVATAVARLIDSPQVELLNYSRRLIGVLNERSAQFESSIASLRAIAKKTGDSELEAGLEQAERRFEELKAAEREALRIADEERRAKETAAARATKAEAEARSAETKFEEERKRTLFLTSIGSLDTQNIINMHHQVTIYAADIKQQIENCIAAVTTGDLGAADLVSRLEQISFVNQKVLSIARLATRANFRLESDMIEADLADYIQQYIEEGARPFLGHDPHLEVTNSGPSFVCKFRPMEVSIVIDNLVDNARKARASKVAFRLGRPDRATLTMEVSDDGRGLPADVDVEEIFGLGFSRTSGSGLGLYHVRQILGEMNGAISARAADLGACFVVRFTA